jgi:hypothetical protein
MKKAKHEFELGLAAIKIAEININYANEQLVFLITTHSIYPIPAPEPGCAADTAGAATDLGAISPAKRGRLLVASPTACLAYAARRRKRAFHVSQAAARTLPPARCAHSRLALDARQRRS